MEFGAEIQSNKFTVAKNDLLVSKLNPWFNRVVYSNGETMAIASTEFVVWRTQSDEIKNFLYMVSRDQSFISHCTLSAAGTSHSHRRVNPDVMMRYSIAFDQSTAERLGSTLSPAIQKLQRNKVESRQLAALRDWLLPMLMNGQVTVK